MANHRCSSHPCDPEGNTPPAESGSTAGYVYDALNHRVSIKTSGGQTDSIFDLAGRVTSNWTSATTANESHIFADGMQIAFRSGDQKTYFNHKDWLSTDRVHTDLSGATAATYTLLPFGDGSTDTVNETYGGSDFARFGDMDDDWFVNTYYAQFREYSQAQGRWLSPDPYDGSYDLTNPQSFNRYTYVLNDPLSLIDPSGLVVQCSTITATSYTWGWDYDPDGDYWYSSITGTTTNVTQSCTDSDGGGGNAPNTGNSNSGSSSGGSSGGGSSSSSNSGKTSAPSTGTIAPSTEQSDAQQRCINGLIGASAIAGVGSALGIQPPGIDPGGDLNGAIKNAAHNPVIVMTAGAMAARLGGTLLTRAGALAVGEAVSSKFVPALGAVATAYGVYTAVSDGIDYFKNNMAACHDAKKPKSGLSKHA